MAQIPVIGYRQTRDSNTIALTPEVLNEYLDQYGMDAPERLNERVFVMEAGSVRAIISVERLREHMPQLLVQLNTRTTEGDT